MSALHRLAQAVPVPEAAPPALPGLALPQAA